MGMIGNSLAQGLISGANIQDGTVDTADLKDGAVHTAKVADGAVHTDKIADGAVTAAKIADGAAVPSQTGQSGKFLTTDGTTADWATVDTNLVADTTPELGGNLAMGGYNATGGGNISAVNVTASDSVTTAYLKGSRQFQSSYDSSNNLIATPTGVQAQDVAFIHLAGGDCIAPNNMHRTSGDWPAPYGIGFGTGGESSGIFQKYASNGSSFGDMVFYVNNDNVGAFSFMRGTWESTSYHPNGSNLYNNELLRVEGNGDLYPKGIIKSTNGTTAHTYHPISRTNAQTSAAWQASMTGNITGSFDVTAYGYPSGVKAIFCSLFVQQDNYGGSGGSDHAVYAFGQSNPDAPYASSGNISSATDAPFVFAHDGDGVVGAGTYGLFGNGLVPVNSNNNIYYNLAYGYSGGTHYVTLLMNGYLI